MPPRPIKITMFIPKLPVTAAASGGGGDDDDDNVSKVAENRNSGIPRLSSYTLPAVGR